MDLDKVILIVMDEYENFNSESTQWRVGNNLWKKVIQVSNRVEFDKEYENLEVNQDFIFGCHLFHAKEGGGVPLRGYYKLTDSKIEKEYQITAHLVSSGDSGEVMRSLFNTERVSRPVNIYSSLRDSIESNKIVPDKKRDKNQQYSTVSPVIKVDPVDFGIITALYTDEFSMIEELFEWTGTYKTIKKVYKLGYPKSNPSKKIVAIHLSETGIVDASIIATQMAEIFKPQIIMMPGVCGGDITTGIGDIIVAKKVFMFQKGKISDIRDKEGQLIKLYDAQGREVDTGNLQDEKGESIILKVEKFEIEHNSICELDYAIRDVLEPHFENIKDKINREIKAYNKEINIHFAPMACSTMVINREGYFEQNVKIIDRKAIALEMESYGIARACEFANEGKTNFLIFKSVMDNMQNKEDANKSFAGKTSALFLKYLLELKII